MINSETHREEKYFTKALRNGKLVDISEVKNGLECNCICPSCETPVVAYNNPKNKNAHHFKHHSKQDCEYYYETILHFLAKEIIQRHGGMTLPNITFNLSSYASTYNDVQRWDYKRPRSIQSVYVQFDNIEVEKYRNGIKPDLIGIINNKELYIEVAVTHFIDESKKEKIKNQNLSVIEIDLSGFDRNTQEDKLKEALSGSISNMKWINNPTIKERENKFKKKQIQIQYFIIENAKEYKVYGKNNRIYNCPIINNREYEVSTDNCDRCLYKVEEHEGFAYRPEINSERPYHPQLRVSCIGHVWRAYESLLTNLGANVHENRAFGK